VLLESDLKFRHLFRVSLYVQGKCEIRKKKLAVDLYYGPYSRPNEGKTKLLENVPYWSANFFHGMGRKLKTYISRPENKAAMH
jgi:hypothetical protein